jgi:hypothetical protein
MRMCQLMWLWLLAKFVCQYLQYARKYAIMELHVVALMTRRVIGSFSSSKDLMSSLRV